jgi:hypothetical protein
MDLIRFLGRLASADAAAKIEATKAVAAKDYANAGPLAAWARRLACSSSDSIRRVAIAILVDESGRKSFMNFRLSVNVSRANSFCTVLSVDPLKRYANIQATFLDFCLSA